MDHAHEADADDADADHVPDLTPSVSFALPVNVHLPALEATATMTLAMSAPILAAVATLQTSA